MTDLTEAAFQLLAEECAASSHSLCRGSLECDSLGEAHRIAVQRRALAEQFDAGRDRALVNGQQPAHNWSTAALLRTVTDLLLRPPVANELWRSISITTGLARLGERGLSADSVVRTCIGPSIIRRILLDTGLFWSAYRNGDIPEHEVPDILRPWCSLFDAENSLTTLGQPLPIHAANIAGASTPGDSARHWLQTASIAHILAWRIENYLEVVRSPVDLVLTGGKDATHWIYDRLTHTFLDDWRTESLTWELVFNRDPEGIAVAAGVSPSLLAERTTTEDLIAEALKRKITAPRPSEEVELGLDANAAITSLGLMLEKGLVDGARAMARRIHEAQPRDRHFALAYAFCTIPVSTADARTALEGLEVDGDPSLKLLRAIDLATCALFERNLELASSLLNDIARPLPEGLAWHWDPVDAYEGRAELRFDSPENWLESFATIEHGQPT